MNRKSKILFGLKVFAVCGAAVFMVKGVRDVYADGGNAGIREKANSVLFSTLNDTPFFTLKGADIA